MFLKGNNLSKRSSFLATLLKPALKRPFSRTNIQAFLNADAATQAAEVATANATVHA